MRHPTCLLAVLLTPAVVLGSCGGERPGSTLVSTTSASAPNPDAAGAPPNRPSAGPARGAEGASTPAQCPPAPEAKVASLDWSPVLDQPIRQLEDDLES